MAQASYPKVKEVWDVELLDLYSYHSAHWVLILREGRSIEVGDGYVQVSSVVLSGPAGPRGARHKVG